MQEELQQELQEANVQQLQFYSVLIIKKMNIKIAHYTQL